MLTAVTPRTEAVKAGRNEGGWDRHFLLTKRPFVPSEHYTTDLLLDAHSFIITSEVDPREVSSLGPSDEPPSSPRCAQSGPGYMPG